VKAIVDAGLSLQHVRSAARLASAHFDTDHPFASQRVFTDGLAIFSAITDDSDAPNIVKWKAGEIEQVIAGGVFDQFLKEIEFDATTALAHRWWPLGKATPIVLDPRINFGAPIVAGTAVRSSVVAGFARHVSIEQAAVAFELQMEQAQAAVNFETELLAA